MYRFVAVLSLVATLLPTPARAQEGVSFPGPRDEARAPSGGEVRFPGPAGETSTIHGQSGLPPPVAAEPAFSGPREEDRAPMRRKMVAQAGTVTFPGSISGKPARVTVTTHGRRQSAFVTRRRPKGQRNRPMTIREYERSRYRPIRVYSGPTLSAAALRKQLEKSGVFVTQSQFQRAMKGVNEQVAALGARTTQNEQNITDLQTENSDQQTAIDGLKKDVQERLTPPWHSWAILGLIIAVIIILAMTIFILLVITKRIVL